MSEWSKEAAWKLTPLARADGRGKPPTQLRAGRARWATLDVTPSAEYTRGKWFDVVGELYLGRTRQTDDQDSTEVTPRIGFRFHLLSNIADDLRKERQPRRRLVLRNLARVEWRNLHYSDSTPSSLTIRYRKDDCASYRARQQVQPSCGGPLVDCQRRQQ